MCAIIIVLNLSNTIALIKSSTTDILLGIPKQTLRLICLDLKLNRINLALIVSSVLAAKMITKLTLLFVLSRNIVSRIAHKKISRVL